MTKLSADPDRLFQPDLAETGGLGVDILTNQDPGWEMYTLIRRVKISEKKVHSRFNGWYLVKRFDEEGRCYYAIVNLVPGLAWEIIPFATTQKQVEQINARRELISHPSNCITICGFAVLTEENVQEILTQCDNHDLPQSGTIDEIEQIIGRPPVFPNDISVGALAAPRVTHSPPPIRAAADRPLGTPVASDRVRLTDDGITVVTPRLKLRNQPLREVKGNRPKYFDDFVIDHPSENILRPRDENMEASFVRQLSLETGALTAPSMNLHAANPTHRVLMSI